MLFAEFVTQEGDPAAQRNQQAAVAAATVRTIAKRRAR